MTFVLVALATFWAQQFLHAYVTWLPDYISHILVAAMAYGMFLLPHAVLLALAAAAVVGLLHRFSSLPLQRSTVTVPRRRSNVPKLP